MPQRRQPYIRADHPPTIRFTDRDRRILEAIHVFEGMMSLKQIDRLFFSGQGRSQPRARMRALFDHGYVNMPDPQTLHRIPYGETIYWLGREGAALIAGLQGLTLKSFKWRKRPRYSLIHHHLAVNDFRLQLMEAILRDDRLDLRSWIPESEFLVQPDTITYQIRNNKKRRRQMIPDGFFTLEITAQQREPRTLAYLLEMDIGTEDNPRFTREKVVPGIAYLKSQAYAQRSGLGYGRWLIVTTGERRLQNMKQNTERAGGNGLFYFTTLDNMRSEDLLSKPVWWLAGKETPQSIIPIV